MRSLDRCHNVETLGQAAAETAEAAEQLKALVTKASGASTIFETILSELKEPTDWSKHEQTCLRILMLFLGFLGALGCGLSCFFG